MWWSVAEDFLPFDLYITTEEPELEALMNTGGDDEEWGVRAVINHSSYSYSWAFVNSFSAHRDLELFARSGDFTDLFETWLWTADSVSHEVGHTLGLSDDGTLGVGGYYTGHGSGDVAWSPIMGWTNYGLSQWDRGEYPDANTAGEDDLLIITSWNGFDYREDDHGSSTGTATVLDLDEAFLVEGIIERTEDLDYFQLTMEQAGQLQVFIDPHETAPNLDIAAAFYDGEGEVLAESNPPTALHAEFDLPLEAGTYFLSVDGTGYDDPDSPGYSDYGSLGYYVVDGAVEYAEDPGDDDTGDDDTTGGDDDDSDAGDDDDVQPEESDDGGDRGCACAAGGATGSAAGLLLLPLVLRRRRQRPGSQTGSCIADCIFPSPMAGDGNMQSAIHDPRGCNT